MSRARARRQAPTGCIVKKSLRNDWETPEWLLDPVRAVLGDPIPLDPFTGPHNPTGAATFLTRRSRPCGLTAPWDEHAFANPPYGNLLVRALGKIEREAERARSCPELGRVVVNPRRIVALLPAARWEQPYFTSMLAQANAVCLIRSRVRFRRARTKNVYPNGNPYANLFLSFHVPIDEFARAFERVGTVYELGIRSPVRLELPEKY